MQQSGSERRLKPRFNAEMPCTIELAERDPIFPNERLDCRTRDLSESGVGLIAETIYLGYTCVVDEGRALTLSLELPDGVVEMETTTAHYLRLGGDAQPAHYLIGLRITSISEASRSQYISYLEELNKSERVSEL
ncbi:MAG TPA: PilZ domain-containing protein [Pyrinomonadaceae bacterium]|jgi:c-di-GMP-binding flagellar brake protein YcgR|nr:PilZ domain-containing protein [Pyrinomonadaceae bacterium]